MENRLKEETGLDVIEINKDLSCDQVYLSPGMTDESVAFVYCICEGEVSKDYLEADEDIETYLVSKEEAKEILISRGKNAMLRSREIWIEMGPLKEVNPRVKFPESINS